MFGDILCEPEEHLSFRYLKAMSIDLKTTTGRGILPNNKLHKLSFRPDEINRANTLLLPWMEWRSGDREALLKRIGVYGFLSVNNTLFL